MVLFGVFAFVGGGRGAISLATPHPRPGFSGVCPVVPTLPGGAPKEGTLAVCGKPAPPPAWCTKEAAGASTASRPPFAPADNQRPPPSCRLPRAVPRCPGRRHLLVYPVPGLRRGHQSRKQRAGRAGPGYPARGGPAAAERGSCGGGSQGASSRSVSRAFALQAPQPPRGVREPQRPSQSQLRVRNQPLGPTAPPPGRLPAGVFLALLPLFAAAVWLCMT